jgi:two-component system, OmpR family, sensor histidine kinase VicK
MVDSIENLFHKVFNRSAACLLLKVSGTHFEIEAVSDKYLSLTSTTREQLIGKDPFEILQNKADAPEGANTTRNAILEVLNTGHEVIIPDYLYYINNSKSGKLEPYWWKSTFEPIFDENNRVEYILGTATDITDQHISKHHLTEAEEMLHLAINAGDIGTWSIKVNTKEIISSARSKQLYGLNEDEHSTLEVLLNAIHQDHRDRVAAILYESMGSDGTRNYVVDFPVKGIRDQQERWLRSTAKLFFDIGDNSRLLCGTFIDITETKIIEQKKNDFISMVSHEMKTPLTSITAYIDLVLDKLQNHEDKLVLDYLSRARSQTTRLRNIIISFLDLEGVQDGKMPLNEESFYLNKIIKEIVNDMLPLAFNHAIRLDVDQDVMIIADRAKIGLVITNFLSNAIKYSHAGTEIVLQSQVEKDKVTVMVSDRGIGISPRHQKKLFERFYRVDHSQEVKSGFGIGLYLAEEIIKNHPGGEIGVISEEGNGSTFWFSLPRS